VAAIRYITWLTGWEAMIFLIVLEAMAAWLTPAELEDWCSRCFFSAGKTPEIVVINRGVTLIQTLLNKRRNFSTLWHHYYEKRRSLRFHVIADGENIKAKMLHS
jgi:hypothetical protein